MFSIFGVYKEGSNFAFILCCYVNIVDYCVFRLVGCTEDYDLGLLIRFFTWLWMVVFFKGICYVSFGDRGFIWSYGNLELLKLVMVEEVDWRI